MKNTVTISKKEYLKLKCDELKLSMLDEGGVDNWQCYWEALNPDGYESFYELEEKLKEKILGDQNE